MNKLDGSYALQGIIGGGLVGVDPPNNTPILTPAA
jgi:hypothetical protein